MISIMVLRQRGPLSLVEECRGLALIGRELHSVATPALLCHKEPARRIQSPLLGALERKIHPLLVLYGIRDRWLPCTERSYYRRPYAIKNQRGASKIPPLGPRMPKLVLYGIRLLAEQLLSPVSSTSAVENSAGRTSSPVSVTAG